MDTTEPTSHDFVLTVSNCSREQAEQVIAERIEHEEDYGFDYTISAQPLPKTP